MVSLLNNGVLVFISLLSILSDVVSFKIVESSVNPFHYNKSTRGENVIMKCVTSNWYEFCTWKHEERICKFEWKRRFGEVRKQVCDQDLNDRFRFLGNYNQHECSIQLSHVSQSDLGEWTCQMESYVLGPISGNKDKAILNLILDHETDLNKTLINTSKKDENGDKDGNLILTLFRR